MSAAAIMVAAEVVSGASQSSHVIAREMVSLGYG